MKKLYVVLASTREGRAGEAVANWVEKRFAEQKAFAVELVDLLDYPLPPLDSKISPLADKTAEQLVASWSKKIAAGDAYVIVSPEYNHGYSGELKNALDSLKPEWIGKPVGIVGYGGLAGGARSVEQLRLVLIELKMKVAYSNVLIPLIWEAMGKDGSPVNDGANSQLDGLIEELSAALA